MFHDGNMPESSTEILIYRSALPVWNFIFNNSQGTHFRNQWKRLSHSIGLYICVKIRIECFNQKVLELCTISDKNKIVTSDIARGLFNIENCMHDHYKRSLHFGHGCYVCENNTVVLVYSSYLEI